MTGTPITWVYVLHEADRADLAGIWLDVAATIPAAKRAADQRAGRFLPAAGEWQQINIPVDPANQTLLREVPGIGWQRIDATVLHPDPDQTADPLPDRPAEDLIR